jgi:hypothetical protein
MLEGEELREAAMKYIHPALMLAFIVLAGYVLALGWARFQSRSLGRRIVFQWKRHVLLGQVVLIGFALGAAGGAFVVWNHFGVVGKTGPHFLSALYAILPLTVLSYATGLYLDRAKPKAGGLPLLHGISGALLYLAALLQAAGGLALLIK